MKKFETRCKIYLSSSVEITRRERIHYKSRSLLFRFQISKSREVEKKDKKGDGLNIVGLLVFSDFCNNVKIMIYLF